MKEILINADGSMSPYFRQLVQTTVDTWIEADDKTGNNTRFLVTAVMDLHGKDSYWGIINVKDTPREDLYVEIERRFYCGYRTVGVDKVIGMSLLDIRSLTDRPDVSFLESY